MHFQAYRFWHAQILFPINTNNFSTISADWALHISPPDNKFSSIGPIYYEYGSMVITFNSSNMAVNAYEILKSQKHDDKRLLGRQACQNAFCLYLSILTQLSILS